MVPAEGDADPGDPSPARRRRTDDPGRPFQGNVRIETLRAFTEAEYRDLIAEVS